jgi:hypothetical protein
MSKSRPHFLSPADCDFRSGCVEVSKRVRDTLRRRIRRVIRIEDQVARKLALIRFRLAQLVLLQHVSTFQKTGC